MKYVIGDNSRPKIEEEKKLSVKYNLLVYIFIEFKATIQPTKIFPNPTNLFISNFLDSFKIKYVKMSNF